MKATAPAPVATMALAVVLGMATYSTTRAADWPALGRDATRNAATAEKGAPSHWKIPTRATDKTPAKPGENIRWEAQLGSNTFASPVVAGGLVWVGTNNDAPRDPKSKEDAAVLMCFREADGTFLWQHVSPRLGSENEDVQRSPLSCSPLAEGDRLYFTTNCGEVVCLDVAALRAGKGVPRVVWKLDTRKDLGVRLCAYSMLGTFTCSIAPSYKGRLYVTTGNGIVEPGKPVPAPKAPSLLCLDAKTGKVLWSDNSPGKNIMLSQWPSPLVAEVKGRGQVMAAQGDGWLRSFDALTGKLLWKFDLNPKKAMPYKPGGNGEKNFPLATPVLFENRVYIGTGQESDDGVGVGHLWCIDITKTPTNTEKDVSPVGDHFDPKHPANKDSALVWHYGGPVVPKPKDLEAREFVFGRTLSNVAIHKGLVIAPELAGYVHCLDARTGKSHWVADVEAPLIASPLIADGKVYVPVDTDEVWVFELSSRKRVLARNKVNTCRSGMVFANGTLYLAANRKLYAIRTPGRGGEKIQPKKEPPPKTPPRERVPRSAFAPTPQSVVEKMLEEAKVTKGDVVFDLGCGDGRIPVTAARKYGCRAHGFDIDSECVTRARELACRAGVGSLVRVEEKDLYSVDLGRATVVTLYLPPGMNAKLIPRLAQLRPGARIICHRFALPGVVADRVIMASAKEEGGDRKLFLYTAPLKKAKKPD